MDEALDLAGYLPLSFKTPNEQEYITFLWETFEDNYNTGKYQFSFLAYHMLMMSFVYFKVWQVRQFRLDDFKTGLIGFSKDDERNLLNGQSPFAFGNIKESAIMRLFRLIGCDIGQIGKYTKLVRDRNEAAHANGNIHFKTQHAMDDKIRQVLQAVEEIQSNFKPLVSCAYGEFVLQSLNPDSREYLDTKDQIREILIKGNYMSCKDIEICAAFDISIVPGASRQDVNDLHDTLRDIHGIAAYH